jgi:branched-chain amino acid transport system ATP-binding protein
VDAVKGARHESAALECLGLHLTLGGRAILSDVSLTIAPGEVVGIAGPNGAGKTSLFDVISGRRHASKGHVRLGGRDLTRLSVHRRVRTGLGRTFQHPVVPDALTVGDTLEAARKAYYPETSRLDAEWAVDLVGLRSSSRELAESLDTLERRKLLLACVTMRHPRVLLMDEPASGLVTSEIDELDAILKRLAWELNLGVALIEHRLELLSAIADRVLVLDAGVPIAEGPGDEVFNLQVVRDAYFQDAA